MRAKHPAIYTGFLALAGGQWGIPLYLTSDKKHRENYMKMKDDSDLKAH